MEILSLRSVLATLSITLSQNGRTSRQVFNIEHPGKCYALYKNLTVHDQNAVLMGVANIEWVSYWHDSLSGDDGD